MAAQQEAVNDTYARDEEPRKTVKRRGLIAGVAALTAAVIANQASQPVGATSGTGLDGALVMGSNNANTPNFAADTTLLQRKTGAGNISYLFSVEGISGAPANNFTDNVGAIFGHATGTGTAVTGYGGSVGVHGEGFTANQIGVEGVNDAPAGGIGIRGAAAAGYGAKLTGGFAPLQLVPAAAGTGAPATGAHLAGELYVDSAGSLFYCKTAGTPGTWINLTAVIAPTPFLHFLSAPDRYIDTRSGFGGITGPLPSNTTKNFQMTGRTGQNGITIPDSATAILGTLTAVGTAASLPGSFLTLWASGSQPPVSNVNYGPPPSSVLATQFTEYGRAGRGGPWIRECLQPERGRLPGRRRWVLLLTEKRVSPQ